MRLPKFAVACGLGLALTLPCVVLSAGEEAPSAADNVPTWALGRLRIRALGKSLDRLAKYCDAVQTNTGAIARMTVAAKLFFPIPIDEGTDEDGAVTIYAVSPAIPGDPIEKAMILPVKDAAVLKEALNTLYEAADGDDHLKIVVPQGFDKPEKNFFVRIGEKQALVATSQEILKRLGSVAESELKSASDAKSAPDGALAMNLGALRRQYLKKVEAALMMAMVLLPLSGADGQSVLKGVIDKSREIQNLDLRAAFKESDLVLATRIKALPDTPTALLWSKPAPKMTGELLDRFPTQTAMLLQMPVENLVWTDIQLLRTIQGIHGPAAGDAAKVFKACGLSIRDLARSLKGEVATGVRPFEEGGAQWYFALQSADSATASQAIRAYFESFERVIAKTYASTLGLQPGDPLPWRLKALPKTEVDGQAVWAYEVLPSDAFVLPEAAREITKRALGWPATIRGIALEDGLMIIAGKHHDAAVRELIKRVKQNEDRGLAALENVALGARSLPAGTDFWAMSRPIPILRASLAHLVDPKQVDLAKFFAGLSSGAVQVDLATGDAQATLRVSLPAATVKGLLRLYLRMRFEGHDLLKIFRNAPGFGPKRAPAPPPPPQP